MINVMRLIRDTVHKVSWIGRIRIVLVKVVIPFLTGNQKKTRLTFITSVDFL